MGKDTIYVEKPNRISITKTFANIASMKNLNEHIQWNEAKWDKRSNTYDLKVFDYFRYLQRKVIAQLNILPHHHLLDIGCGTGWAVHHIAKKLNDEGKFFGIDISNGMLDKARQKVNGYKNVTFIKSSSDELPFENEYFDFVICTNSFHHYPFPQKTLSEIYRVLKSNGQVFILDISNDNILAKALDKYFRLTEKEHIRFYSLCEFIRMFSLAGFSFRESKKAGIIFKIHCAEKAF
jgi:ubiquinone/menaquinone biosynthesis C-methylase UbiE